MVQPQEFPVIPGISLMRVIGRGGFATVYEGVESSFARRVAVKVFNATAADREARKQFEAECRAVGTLSELDVVTVHWTGIVPAGKQFYL
ncbi:protein kinase, partial [Saccharothrix sp. MB29]|nr:protein kinase [Saccharothrix sp. MB29]